MYLLSLFSYYPVGISETDSFHDTEPGPLPIHSVRSADHFYQKSFPVSSEVQRETLKDAMKLSTQRHLFCCVLLVPEYLVWFF